MIEKNKEWHYEIEEQHLTGNPKIYGDDLGVLRRQFFEAACSTGVTVDFYRCRYDKADFYQDPNVEWDLPIKLNVIFDDHPKVKVLKDLGWYTEDDEHPTLIYFPIYSDWSTKTLLDVRENSLIRVYYFGQVEPADFRVMDKKLDSVYGIYWVCKIAPERIREFYTITKHGEHFLKRDMSRMDTPDCIHSIKSGGDERDYDHGHNQNYVNNDTGDDYYSRIMDSYKFE